MEHSMRAYIERQSTEKLDRFLQDCLSGAAWKDYADVIPVIMEVFAEREQQIKDSIPADIWQELMERLLKAKEVGR